MTITKEAFRAVMGSFAAGVTLVTTTDSTGARWGLTATAFSSLSLDPALCLVCLDKRTASLPAFLEKRGFAVNILGAGQEELSNRFASRSEDKFARGAWSPGEATGAPVLADALASMECSVAAVHEGGDHLILVGALQRVTVTEGDPLLYFRGGYAGVLPRDKA
jgi:flavin reductase (DIM6/NTAB) family NADH-FMN oxidoreductase RutF